ncbi:hypothetical protein QM996_18230 [Sinorhizobium chiapasense]
MAKQLLTSDEFVAGIMATLALQNRKHFTLVDTELDLRFQDAFNDLIQHQDELGVTPNFTFAVDPLHGDSVCLRDTLLSAKEKELIALNNPTFRTFDIKLTDQRAARYLDRIPLKRGYLSKLVEEFFSDLG